MATTKPRLKVTVTEETLKEIEAFQAEKKYPSQSSALNYLILLGLETHKLQNSHRKDSEVLQD